METIYESHSVIIETPFVGSSDIFVTNKNDRGRVVQMRISATDREMCVTAHNGVLTPSSVHRLPAFRVTPAR